MPITISILLVISLSLLLVLCCCRRAGNGENAGQDPPRDPRDDGIHVATSWESPYFCEPCGRRYNDYMFPKDENTYITPWWFENKVRLTAPRASDFGTRQHLFEHGEGKVDKEYMPKHKETIKPEEKELIRKTLVAQKTMYEMSKKPSTKAWPLPASSSHPSRIPEILSSPAPPAAGGPVNSPAYESLYPGKGGPVRTCAIPRKGAPTMVAGESQMKAAQANPAYQTVWNAKTGVFDKAGGGGGQRPPGGPAMSMASEGRMRAAAANPAYGTLYAAQSGVFEKAKAGGGGPVAPSTSNYRD